jgi:hypothetical protein
LDILTSFLKTKLCWLVSLINKIGIFFEKKTQI